MRLLAIAVWLSFTARATSPQRSIDWCAQDGAYFYAWTDDPSQPVQTERDGIGIRIERPHPKSADALVSFTKGKRVLTQKHRDFETVQGWLTVSPSGAFAVTWKDNASSAESQIFQTTPSGEIFENTELLPLAERAFVNDAIRVCKTPGANMTAIKWIDDDHLLLSMNAWASGFCYSNFTEGFVVSLVQHRIERKLTERELINLPAVCTWNLVSNQRR